MHHPASPCTPPAGNLRWLHDLSSNLSRFGVRGYHDLVGRDFQAVFQLEAQVDVTATPGSKPNGSNDTINPANTAVTGALASRNSFVGVSTPFGALKLGKNDTPYKSVTADFDFLADTPGDYNSIMGNTGGDNRTEFDARLPHAVWYESPDLMGFRLNAIWSPGQNRFEDNIGYAIGENACSGGNAGPCNDGAFGDAYGFSAEWHGFGLKLILAHEMHKKTNRTGDAGQTTPAGTSVVGTANEYAWKFGAKYTFEPTGTTVAGIFEEMRRNDASAFNPKTTIILSYAHMRNSSAAHFALGAGGHGVTWDCKDGSGPSTASAGPGIGLIGNGTGCFTGTSPQAFSLGMTYDF